MILEANLTAATLLGVARATLAGQYLTRFVLPEDESVYFECRKRLFETGAPQTCDLRMLRGDGAQFCAQVEAVVRHESEGSLLCRATMSDITQRKRAEEEQIRLAAELQQAQKMESVGRLAGGVAHDSNNMLTVIIGYADLALQKVPPTDPLHGDLMGVLGAARRSAQLTKQLLAFARKQTIKPEVLDLNKTVERSLDLIRRLVGEDITLDWIPKPDLWSINIDPSQIDQILTNLCANARDAIGGVGRITIATNEVTLDELDCAKQVDAVPGELVVLSVSDDGRGMSQETQANLFEPFFTTKEIGQGTGLGLATVYGIVKQNGGFISVSSGVGEGTAIEIHLPRHVGEQEKTGEVRATRAPRAQGETVLLVEDEPGILKVGIRMLTRLGYEVRATSSPAEAVQWSEEPAGRIDLLITDVVMPEMDGRNLAELLQARCPGLKVLFMSGYTAGVIAQRGVLEEGVHFIQKPFSTEELAFKVRTLLDFPSKRVDR